MCGHHRTAHEEHAPQVGVHDLVPLFHRRGPHGRVIDDDPGVVDEDVYLPPGLDELFRHPDGVVFTRHVQLEGLRDATLGANLIDHRRQTVHVASGYGGPGAFAGEGHGDCPADAAPAARNQGDPVFQCLHTLLPRACDAGV